MAPIYLGLDLILSIRLKSYGSGKRALGAAEGSPELDSRGGASPALGKRDRPGSIWDEVKPWRMLATRVIHLGSWCRSTGVATARATAWAARVSKARRRARVPVPTVAYDPRRLALKVRGEDVVLTKVRNGLERGGVVTSTADRRRRRSGFVGGATAEGLRAPDHRRSTRGGPVKVRRGSARPMAYRR
jgi:hypothetical protein